MVEPTVEGVKDEIKKASEAIPAMIDMKAYPKAKETLAMAFRGVRWLEENE